MSSMAELRSFTVSTHSDDEGAVRELAAELEDVAERHGATFVASGSAGEITDATENKVRDVEAATQGRVLKTELGEVFVRPGEEGYEDAEPVRITEGEPDAE
jgi:hypothetical protein